MQQQVQFAKEATVKGDLVISFGSERKLFKEFNLHAVLTAPYIRTRANASAAAIYSSSCYYYYLPKLL